MSSGDSNGRVPSPMAYGDYLELDQLLSAQKPLSAEHDELLFIVVHQASELWMRLSLHELGAARRQIRDDDLGPAFKMIARVSRIQGQLIQSWDVLATMTPTEYARIRPSLGQSSGFQSYQYRELEFLLGAKNVAALTTYEASPDIHARLFSACREPSLYDEALRLLARRGLRVPAWVLERDWTQAYASDPQVEEAWLEIYRDPAKWWDLYELAEKLVDLEFRFQQWRFAHLKTVERIIGFKTGTGGSSGVSYLGRALDNSFFPELISLRTKL
jgi:tryptophan 2,3-dioxygenase